MNYRSRKFITASVIGSVIFIFAVFLLLPQGKIVYSQASSVLWSQPESSPTLYSHKLAVDSTGLYELGFTTPFVNMSWIIRKRNISDGSLAWSVPSNPGMKSTLNTGGALPSDIAVDSTAVYIGGYSGYFSAWRVEKRSKIDGGLFDGHDAAHSPVFGSGGIITANTGFIVSIALSSSNLFLIGTDNAAAEMILEKRSKTTGRLCTATECGAEFGSGGAIGIPYGNCCLYDAGIAADSSNLYLVGSAYDHVQIQKRNLTSGSLDPNFGTSGIVNVYGAPFHGMTWNLGSRKLAIDSNALYWFGYINNLTKMYVEKRDIVNGQKLWGAEPTNFLGSAAGVGAITVDSMGLYIVGVTGPGEWLMQKRDVSTGNIATDFGVNGELIGNYGSGGGPMAVTTHCGVEGIYWAGGFNVPGYVEKISKPVSSCPCGFDIGLRVQTNSGIKRIGVETVGTTPMSPLRIAKNGVTYGVCLVPPGDLTSTGIRVRLGDGTLKDLRQY